MTLQEEVSEIFKEFEKKHVHFKTKDRVEFIGYDPKNTYMEQLIKKNKKR